MILGKKLRRKGQKIPLGYRVLYPQLQPDGLSCKEKSAAENDRPEAHFISRFLKSRPLASGKCKREIGRKRANISSTYCHLLKERQKMIEALSLGENGGS